MEKSFEDIINSSGLADLINQMKLGKVHRALEVSESILKSLSYVVENGQCTQVRDLLEAFRFIYSFLIAQNLVETAATNMVRRVMRIVRDECFNFNNSDDRIHDAISTLDIEEKENEILELGLKDVKSCILEAIQEVSIELELSSKIIAEQSKEHIQNEEIILTLGKSKIIESFLRHARKRGKKRFTVIVVELAPFYSGREMANALNEADIATQVIPDSAVFAVMSRVNKVIIGIHSMMANGGMKAPAGSHSIALAAKHFSVPLIVCCPMYKLTPEYLVSHDSSAFNQFSRPHKIVPSYANHVDEHHDIDPSEDKTNQEYKVNQADVIDGECGHLDTIHSIFDYVPPELVTLFVSNNGGNSPSYVYQLLNELYCKLDYLT